MLNQERAIKCFVRDDDVGELTDALRFFASAFIARAIPVSYQIIPALLTEACADYLRGLWQQYPGLVEFGQHGLRHEMTLGGRHTWREFGPERSFPDQRSDIAEGLGLLRARLGNGPDIGLFTPPQHKYDGNTVRAVADVGMKVFSAAAYVSLHHRLAYRMGRALGLSSLRHYGISYHGRRRPEAPVTEMSIAITVDNGGSIRCPATGLRSAIDRASQHVDRVGLMVHHAVYGRPDRREELTAIGDVLVALGSNRFHLLTALAD